MNEKWTEYLRKLRRDHGPELDLSQVQERFLPYFNTKQRIKVKFPGGATVTGTVTVRMSYGDNARAPVLHLRRRINSVHPDDSLTGDVELVAELVREDYLPVPRIYPRPAEPGRGNWYWYRQEAGDAPRGPFMTYDEALEDVRGNR